jgi:hypothetical protein
MNRPRLIIAGMETQAEIRERWRYLRDLLIEQLSRFESGRMQLHANDINVSAGAIATLKQNIQDFDELISRSEARDGPSRPAPEHSD